MKLITKIKERYKKWQERKFLERHGCNHWEQYHHRHDPKVYWPATTIANFYHGYPHRFVFEDHKHDVYYWDFSWDGSRVVHDWCAANCVGKYRMDFHRCRQGSGEWVFDELGGGDYIWVAFEDERDLVLFILRWL